MNMIEGRILFNKCQAEYWIAMATTGAAKRRKLYHGTVSPDLEFTDEEKIEDALNTAARHLQTMADLIEGLF